MLTIPEKSRQGFAFVFEDEELRPFIPNTVRYRLHDPDTGVEFIPWTAEDAALRVEIVIPATANRIVDDNNAFEQRTLTVQSDFDTDDQLSQERTYRVENLSGFA